MFKFKCQNCGSGKLAYHKYVRCMTPVEIKGDGTVFYKTSLIDEENYLEGVSNGFCCFDCGHLVEHGGCRFEIEKDLLDYLVMDTKTRAAAE